MGAEAAAGTEEAAAAAAVDGLEGRRARVVHGLCGVELHGPRRDGRVAGAAVDVTETDPVASTGGADP